MKRIVLGVGSLLVLAGVILPAPRAARADDLASQSYQVLAPVITSGGGYASSTSFSLTGVIAEFAHDLSDSLSFDLVPGFAAYPFVSTPVVSATAGNASVSLSWTAATGVLGYSVSGYSVGQSAVSGGPYSFSSVGNVLSHTVSSLTNGTTYYFVVRALDPFSIVIATSSQASAAPAAPATPPASSGGGGGGGGGGGAALPSSTGSVLFFGKAYPKSSVTLLKDAQVAATTVAGTDASFMITLANLSAGNYVFSMYSEDKNGYRSALLTFLASVTAGVTTNVSGIFIAPTIAVDKSEVSRGDTIAIFGQVAPQAEVVIEVNSDEQFFSKTVSDNNGIYLYNFDSSVLEYGSHSARSKGAINNQLVSGFSSPAAFKVGTRNVFTAPVKKCSASGDLNTDCKTNLVDFSVMAYWYQRPLSASGAKADLNHDGKVNITDFSILAANWTG